MFLQRRRHRVLRGRRARTSSLPSRAIGGARSACRQTVRGVAAHAATASTRRDTTVLSNAYRRRLLALRRRGMAESFLCGTRPDWVLFSRATEKSGERYRRPTRQGVLFLFCFIPFGFDGSAAPRSRAV